MMMVNTAKLVKCRRFAARPRTNGRLVGGAAEVAAPVLSDGALALLGFDVWNASGKQSGA